MSALGNSRELRRVALDALRLPDEPVKRHSASQIKKAARFLTENEQIPLVYAEPDGTILWGGEFWLALRQNGTGEVDVVFVHGKSPEELKAIRLFLHRIPKDAKWNYDHVRSELACLADVDFDLSLTGFDAGEIEALFTVETIADRFERAVNEIPVVEQTAIVEPGSLWALGHHRLGCGNALDLPFVQRLLEGRSASLCFSTAPTPFNTGGQGDPNGLDATAGFARRQASHFELLTQSLTVLKTCSAPDALIFLGSGWNTVSETTIAGRASNLALRQIITLLTTRAIPGELYDIKSQFICAFSGSGNAVRARKNKVRRSNVWTQTPAAPDIGNSSPLHVNAKPVSMIVDALRDFTKRGELVLDCFLGAGSTLIAAEKCGRICCGVDIDPLHLDVAIRRWQNATGRQATRLDTGAPFNGSASHAIQGFLETKHAD